MAFHHIRSPSVFVIFVGINPIHMLHLLGYGLTDHSKFRFIFLRPVLDPSI